MWMPARSIEKRRERAERRYRGPLAECEYVRIADKLTPADTLSYFERIRGYIQHEDGLINSRLTWSLTIHGFLFAIYGLLLGKLVDILLNPHSVESTPMHHAFAGLLCVQALVAGFGVIVGIQSRVAIGAASRALIYIRWIAHASTALVLESPETAVSLAWSVNRPGLQAVKTHPPRDFIEDEGVLIEGNSPSRGETVRVKRVIQGGFEAEFRERHAAGAKVQPLGFALLPKVVNGGAPDSLFRSAAWYYLALPLWATMIWLLLLAASADLAHRALVDPQSLFRSAVVPAQIHPVPGSSMPSRSLDTSPTRPM